MVGLYIKAERFRNPKKQRATRSVAHYNNDPWIRSHAIGDGVGSDRQIPIVFRTARKSSRWSAWIYRPVRAVNPRARPWSPRKARRRFAMRCTRRRWWPRLETNTLSPYFTDQLRGREKETGIKTKKRVKLAAKMLMIAWTLMKKQERFDPQHLGAGDSRIAAANNAKVQTGGYLRSNPTPIVAYRANMEAVFQGAPDETNPQRGKHRAELLPSRSVTGSVLRAREDPGQQHRGQWTS